jgi:hypothetical protein
MPPITTEFPNKDSLLYYTMQSLKIDTQVLLGCASFNLHFQNQMSGHVVQSRSTCGQAGLLLRGI